MLIRAYAYSLNSCIGYSLFLHVLLLLNMRALSLIECRCIVITLRFIKITTVKGFWFFTIRYLLTYMHWYLYVCQLLFYRYLSYSCLFCSFCRSSVWWSWWWWSTPPAGFLWTSSTSPETSTPPSTTPRAWTTSGCHFTGSPWATVCTIPSSTVGWTRNSGMGSGGYWVTSRAVTLKWRTRWSCLTSGGRTQWIRR